jgi:hypothetical protein
VSPLLSLVTPLFSSLEPRTHFDSSQLTQLHAGIKGS